MLILMLMMVMVTVLMMLTMTMMTTMPRVSMPIADFDLPCSRQVLYLTVIGCYLAQTRCPKERRCKTRQPSEVMHENRLVTVFSASNYMGSVGAWAACRVMHRALEFMQDLGYLGSPIPSLHSYTVLWPLNVHLLRAGVLLWVLKSRGISSQVGGGSET